jgi:hypothetical protein
VSKPQVIDDEEHERVFQAVAAVDVAKKDGVVCLRGPHRSRPGGRQSTVWTVPATMSAVAALGEQLAAAGVQKVTLESALLSANRAGDQLVVTKLDRLGRSLEHLIELSTLLHTRQVDLVVLDQGTDTSTAVSRMFFQILGAIAEFEHALMSERTMEGLAARGRDRTGGKSPNSAPAWPLWPSRCTTKPAPTVGAATPCRRSPPSSASPALPPAPPAIGTSGVTMSPHFIPCQVSLNSSQAHRASGSPMPVAAGPVSSCAAPRTACGAPSPVSARCSSQRIKQLRSHPDL